MKKLRIPVLILGIAILSGCGSSVRIFTDVDDSSDISIKITIYHREANDHYLYHRGSYNYMEQAIAVDVYDNQTRKHVWHGAAVGEIDYDSAERAEEIPVIASTLFEEYPVHLPTDN